MSARIIPFPRTPAATGPPGGRQAAARETRERRREPARLVRFPDVLCVAVVDPGPPPSALEEARRAVQRLVRRALEDREAANCREGGPDETTGPVPLPAEPDEEDTP